MFICRDDTLRDDTIDENVDNKELIAKLLESFPSLNFSSFNNSKRPWTKAEVSDVPVGCTA